MCPRQMAKNAVAWAKQNGLARTNAIHGAEEFRVPTFETFKHREQEKTVTRAKVGAVLKDLGDTGGMKIVCKSYGSNQNLS